MADYHPITHPTGLLARFLQLNRGIMVVDRENVKSRRAILNGVTGAFNWMPAIFGPLQKGIAVQDDRFGNSEWITPDGVVPGTGSPVLLYFHGGGYCLGSLDTHRALFSFLARRGHIPVFALDYPLAPENPFPAALDTALDAYQHLLNLGHKPKDIVIGGDSCGGGLALALLQKIKQEKLAAPAGAVLISPWLDVRPDGGKSGGSRVEREPVDAMLSRETLRAFANLYTEPENWENPLVSPLLGDVSGLPPILIHGGSEEILYDDSVELEKKVLAAGGRVDRVEWPGQFHVFQAFPHFLKDANESLLEISSFVLNMTT